MSIRTARGRGRAGSIALSRPYAGLASAHRLVIDDACVTIGKVQRPATAGPLTGRPSAEGQLPVHDLHRPRGQRPRRRAAGDGAVEVETAAVTRAVDRPVGDLGDVAPGVRADRGEPPVVTGGGLGDHDLEGVVD